MDTLPLEELQEEVEFQKLLLSSVTDDVPEPDQARKQIKSEIAELIKEIASRKKKSAPVPSTSGLTNPFSPSIGTSMTMNDSTMGDSSATNNMNPSRGRKRSNTGLSPSYRNSKSQRTTPSSGMTSESDDAMPTSSFVNRQKEQEAARAMEARDLEMARQMQQTMNAPVASSSTLSYNMKRQPQPPYTIPGPKVKTEPTTSSLRANFIEISDDSELEEIGSREFKGNNRKPSTPASSRRAATPIDLTGNMSPPMTGFGAFRANYGRPTAMGMDGRPYGSGSDSSSALTGFGGTSVYGNPGFPSVGLPDGLLPAIQGGLMSAKDSITRGILAGGKSFSETAAMLGLDAGLNADGTPVDQNMASLQSLLNDPAKQKQDIFDLLNNIQNDFEMAKEDRGGTPNELRFPLYEHQKIALSWMIRSEESRNNRGGILADDMGLGKTISTLALLVANKSEDPRRKTTLIVGPVALVRQWQNELFEKVKPRYRMKTFLYHNTKASWENLKENDVVLTTYGTLAAEFKRLTKWEEKLKINPNMDQSSTTREFPLLGPKSQWYRIILDEAQSIKNKRTGAAHACCQLQSTYRFCLTGTPMMNNVGELFSLIQFLRIKPYNDWTRWQQDFGCLTNPKYTEGAFKHGMEKLRVVIKAIMLRRTKSSKIDGKPILQLPEKIEEVQHVVFDDEQLAFYTSLETRQRLQFNKYVKAGTVGANYANVLVLLLRLRQAACHPHLIHDYEAAPSGTADVTVEEMMELAKTMSPEVIARLQQVESFECPVCYDSSLNPTIILPCGHDICSECLTKIYENGQVAGAAQGEENAPTKCPSCRGLVNMQKVIDYATFKLAHMTDPSDALNTAANPDTASASDSDTDSDSDSDSDSVGDSDDFSDMDDSEGADMKDFIDDGDVEDVDEEASEDEKIDVKGKGKANYQLDSDDEEDVKIDIKGKGKAKYESDTEDEDYHDQDEKIDVKGKGKVKYEGESSDLEDILPAKPTLKKPSKTRASLKAKRRQKKDKKAKKAKRAERKGKGKAKEETAAESAKKHLSLATMRKESKKSREHMKKYMRYLKKNYVPSAKILKCVELIIDAKKRGTKTIVFSQFTMLLDLIEVQLDLDKISRQRYDGSMTSNARHEAVMNFTKRPEYPVFLVSLKAGNAGLNLVEASNVIIMDPFWNPYVEMQAVDRAHRIGQQNVVQVHRIVVKGTVEDKILALQERKKEVIEGALDETASRNMGRLGHQELVYLFSANRHGDD